MNESSGPVAYVRRRPSGRARIRLTAIAILTFAVTAVWPSGAAAVSAGQVYAFGDNREGQLGNPTNNNVFFGAANPTPTLVSLPGATGPVTRVAAGGTFTLALTSTGQLYAFGDNRYGQLGNSTNNGNDNANPTPTLVSLPGASGPVVQLAAGNDFSLVLTSTNQLYGFGDNQEGQLGTATNSNTGNANPMPSLITLPAEVGPITQIAAGEEHSLVVTSTGQLYAFGDNVAGELGNSTNNGMSTANPTPTLVTLPGATGPVTQVAAGADDSLALTATNQLYGFGDNRYGQLGTTIDINESGARNPTPALATLPGATGPITQISLGSEHTLALTSTNQLYAFGDNESGELGNTNNTTGSANPTPTPVTLPGAGGAVTSIEAGSFFSLAVTSAGQLYAWGNNAAGALGSTTNNHMDTPNPTPTQVVFPEPATIETLGRGSVNGSTLAVVANLAVVTQSLPGGLVGAPYSAAPQAVGGAPPYSWSASGLPPGLAIDPVTGLISGVPTAPGVYGAAVAVTDAGRIVASTPLQMTISLPPPPATLLVARVSTSGPTASITVVCSGVSGQSCSDTLLGTVHVRTRAGSVIAVTAGAKGRGHGRPKTKVATVTVARTSFALPAGETRTERLTLNGAGKRLLARFAILGVKVEFTGTLTETRKVTFSIARVHVATPPDRWFHINLPCGNCYATPTDVPITGLPKGAHVTVTCRGRGCPFGRRSVTPHDRRINLASVLGSAHLQASSVVEVTIAARNMVGEVLVYTMRRGSGPLRTIMCVAPGARAPVRCA